MLLTILEGCRLPVCGGGCGHLISVWMKNGMQTPPEQVADELNKICSNFVKAYGR